jgi:GDPmannose 4,6-dehydratase
MKRALITGITGQDGAYLAKFLLEKGYKVFGTYRRISTPNFWRLQYLDVLQKIILIPADMTDMASLLEAVTVADPDEIYNLAAQSYVGASYDQPLHTTEIDGSGATRLLEVIRHLKKDIKFYQASTSELFGTVEESPQSEKHAFGQTHPMLQQNYSRIITLGSIVKRMESLLATEYYSIMSRLCADLSLLHVRLQTR